ncbi:MAG: 3'-5' exonuclease [Erysipelotrichaceae bacterium]
MKVLAIDFETANQYSESACAIGYVLFEDGRMVQQDAYLIKPHPRFAYFNYYNVKIHHISESMVSNAPDFAWVMHQISHLFSDALVIAHNAPFDLKVLRSLCQLYQIALPRFYTLDTVRLARVAFPQLENHHLNTVCSYLNVPLLHHDACSDAHGCMQVYLHAIEQLGPKATQVQKQFMKEFTL